MASQPVVVVIDDSPTIRKIMDLTLQRMGLRMVGAASGVAGLAAVAEHNPAIIFLDIVLPNVNGYQLCQVIKRNPRYRNTPVIMLSGKDGIFDKVRGVWLAPTTTSPNRSSPGRSWPRCRSTCPRRRLRPRAW
jgi:twitching motility two-component system response regulator PilG